MKKVFTVILKTMGLAFITTIFIIATREVFEIGSLEYFTSNGKSKFLENYTIAFLSVLCGWIYVWVFKILGMIKNVEI